MEVDVVIEQRFYRCENGYYWTDNAFSYEFWKRYLVSFSKVNIVARVKDVDIVPKAWKRVDGNDVGFVCLPHYIGPVGFLTSLPSLISILRSRRVEKRKVICRIPSILSAMYLWFSKPHVSEYGAEVVGDPADMFDKGASQSPLRLFYKWLFVSLLKSQCHNAYAISYVTQFSLQKRYPPKSGSFATHYSSIQLYNEDFLARQAYHYKTPIRLVCVGTLSQPYKGCDIMLNALAQLNKQEVLASLTWIGGGALLLEMREMACKLGIEQQVHFMGNVSVREDIRGVLDNSDVFVLPSRQEGLPRALIEAMARSLVCIATDVGGVRELINETYIIQKDNTEQLVACLQSVQALSELARLDISSANYTKSQEYSDSVLMHRRKSLFETLIGS
jgi:colanic acid/amylovoran biosynthesis glycosyltransferase